jgi:hypothetical protein
MSPYPDTFHETPNFYMNGKKTIQTFPGLCHDHLQTFGSNSPTHEKFGNK